MSNIKYFNSEEEYINFLSQRASNLLSPGGAAHLVGVTRNCITNWIYRDGKVRAYIYDSPMDGKYIFVEKSDVISARLNTRKKNTIGDKVLERLKAM